MGIVDQYPDCPNPCHECDTVDHHWMFDYHDDYPDIPIMNCKHCPATRLVGDDEDGNEPDAMLRVPDREIGDWPVCVHGIPMGAQCGDCLFDYPGD